MAHDQVAALVSQKILLLSLVLAAVLRSRPPALEFTQMSQCVASARTRIVRFGGLGSDPSTGPKRRSLVRRIRRCGYASARRFGSSHSASHINCTPSGGPGPVTPMLVLILVALLA